MILGKGGEVVPEDLVAGADVEGGFGEAVLGDEDLPGFGLPKFIVLSADGGGTLADVVGDCVNPLPDRLAEWVGLEGVEPVANFLPGVLGQSGEGGRVGVGKLNIHF